MQEIEWRIKWRIPGKSGDAARSQVKGKIKEKKQLYQEYIVATEERDGCVLPIHTLKS